MAYGLWLQTFQGVELWGLPGLFYTHVLSWFTGGDPIDALMQGVLDESKYWYVRNINPAKSKNSHWKKV